MVPACVVMAPGLSEGPQLLVPPKLQSELHRNGPSHLVHLLRNTSGGPSVFWKRHGTSV